MSAAGTNVSQKSQNALGEVYEEKNVHCQEWIRTPVPQSDSRMFYLSAYSIAEKNSVPGECGYATSYIYYDWLTLHSAAYL